MATSSVPAAWAALHALADTAADTTVHYGPPMNEDDQQYVCIGFDPNGGEPVRTTEEWAALGNLSKEESYGISCFIRSASGDVDLSTRVTEVYGLLDSIADALTADHSLGGSCRVAHLSEVGCDTRQDNAGSAAHLTFTVSVQARIN